MSDIPLDIDALDGLGASDLLVLFHTFDQWLAKGRQTRVIGDLYTFVARTYEYYIRVAEGILGREHPYVQYLRRETLPKVKPYVDKTRMLLRDWSDRWGKRWEMSPAQLDLDLCLRNVIATDCARRKRLVLIESILVALENGTWSEEGLTPIVYELSSGTRGTIALPSEIVSGFSKAENDKTVFEARVDKRVKWDYLFVESISAYEVWLESEGLDIIYRLWHDDWGLSLQAKQEMEKLGWLILERYAKHFTALFFHDETRPGVILVPTHRPWMNKGIYTQYLRDWVVPDFEHETQHLVDWRLADGAPLSSTIAETRAWSAQLDMMRRTDSSPKSIQIIESALEPYLAAISGRAFGFGELHYENHFHARCCTLFSVAKSLGIIGRFVDVLRADE